MVRQTSMEAYWQHDGSSQCRRILEAMQFGSDYSRRELAELTGIEINAVCGRVDELRKQKLIEERPKRKCSITKRNIMPLVRVI